MPHHDDTLDGDAYVFPRHLALATLSGDPALEPLLRLGYLSEGRDDGLWRITAYEDVFAAPAWGVRFNDRCATEFFSELPEAARQLPVDQWHFRGRTS
ncbi:hypothetical protein [Streptomyces mirabilis]|uniref:hypothetical protein n=1 Tax=Streptomyces mirabilis TaxID=68239 RepID=UPI0035D725CE